MYEYSYKYTNIFLVLKSNSTEVERNLCGLWNGPWSQQRGDTVMCSYRNLELGTGWSPYIIGHPEAIQWARKFGRMSQINARNTIIHVGNEEQHSFFELYVNKPTWSSTSY